MRKFKYVLEIEINASKNLLYPYISTPSGLESWFADKVFVDEDNIFNMIWDDENHYAIKVGEQMNKSVKFEFLNEHKEPINDPNLLELTLEKNDFTEMMYLQITDYSESDDEEDLNILWTQLVDGLKVAVGG